VIEVDLPARESLVEIFLHSVSVNPMPPWRALLISYAALFSATGNFVYASDSVERSIHLSQGTPDGFQEVRHQADGSVGVHSEINEKGRGEKLDSIYRLAADGTPLKIDTEGVNYNKAPVSEHFSLSQGEAHWQSLGENDGRAISTPAFYNSLNSAAEEFTLLVRALLKAPGQRLDLLRSGDEARQRIRAHRPGYVSDLILVDGDPLINVSDMRKVRTVLRGDRLYDSASLFQAVGLAAAP
jgi:hypothetical protein